MASEGHGHLLKGNIFFLVALSRKRRNFGEKDGEEAIKPCWAALARAEAAQFPLCMRSRGVPAAPRGFSCPEGRETALTDRKPGDFQFTDRAWLWLLESVTSTFSLENIEGRGKK